MAGNSGVRHRCNGASERSERRKLDMPASRIGWCILPILESGMSSLHYKILMTF